MTDANQGEESAKVRRLRIQCKQKLDAERERGQKEWSAQNAKFGANGVQGPTVAGVLAMISARSQKKLVEIQELYDAMIEEAKAEESSQGSVYITNSQVQFGNHNSQQMQFFDALMTELENSDATEEEKEEAKGLLQKVYESPIVSKVIEKVIEAAMKGGT